MAQKENCWGRVRFLKLRYGHDIEEKYSILQKASPSKLDSNFLQELEWTSLSIPKLWFPYVWFMSKKSYLSWHATRTQPTPSAPLPSHTLPGILPDSLERAEELIETSLRRRAWGLCACSKRLTVGRLGQNHPFGCKDACAPSGAPELV